MAEKVISRKTLYYFENKDRKVECWADNCEHLKPDAIVISGYIEDLECRQEYNRFLHNLWVQKQFLKKLYKVMHVAAGDKDQLLQTIATAFTGRKARSSFQEFLHHNRIPYFCGSNWFWGEDLDVDQRPKMENPAIRMLFDYTKKQFRHSAECFVDDGVQVIGVDSRKDDIWFSFLLEVEHIGLPALYNALAVPEGNKEQLANELVDRFNRDNGWYLLQEFLIRHKIPHGVYCSK